MRSSLTVVIALCVASTFATLACLGVDSESRVAETAANLELPRLSCGESRVLPQKVDMSPKTYSRVQFKKTEAEATATQPCREEDKKAFQADIEYAALRTCETPAFLCEPDDGSGNGSDSCSPSVEGKCKI